MKPPTTMSFPDDDDRPDWGREVSKYIDWDRILKPWSEEMATTAAQFLPELNYDSPVFRAALAGWAESPEIRQLQANLARTVDLPDVSQLFANYARDLPGVEFSQFVNPTGLHGFSTGDISPKISKLSAEITADLTSSPAMSEINKLLAESFKMPDSVMRSLREAFSADRPDTLDDAIRIAEDLPEVVDSVQQTIRDRSLWAAQFVTFFSGKNPVELREMSKPARLGLIVSTVEYVQQAAQTLLKAGEADPLTTLMVLTWLTFAYIVAILLCEEATLNKRDQNPDTGQE